MEPLTVFLLCVVLLCAVLYFRRGSQTCSSGNLPPDKPGLPIIGHLLTWIPKSHQSYVDELPLGDMFLLRLGPLCVLRLNSFRAIQEAFVGQADVFSGRLKGEFVTHIFHDAGVVNTDGPVWQEHRRLMLRLLRDFGFGKSLMNDIIEDETAGLISRLSGKAGRPVVTQAEFNAVTNNVITRVVFGSRCGTDDKEFTQYTEDLAKTLEFKMSHILPFAFPVIVRVSFLRKIFGCFNDLVYYIPRTQEYVRKKIEHQEKMLKEMDPIPVEVDQATNLCEAFLIEKRNQEETNPGNHTFTDVQLMMNISDLFSAGTETTASTLNWAMLLLATNPDIQDRVQLEIKEGIGRERFPTYSDRQALPLVCAVMDEVMRYSSLLPINVNHRTTRDTVLLGFDIPADMIVTSNLYGLHHDPKLWERPNEFYPEHFMTSDGDYKPSKFLIPFSLGKRACLGESLARSEYFAIFVSLMQHFRVKLADTNVDIEKILEGKIGMIRHPLPHQIVFENLGQTE